jgi:hypothetical protein
MAETIVTLSGDDKQLLAALRRISGAQDNVDAGLKKIKKSSKEAATLYETGLNSAVTAVTSLGAGYLSASTAAAALNTVLDAQVERQERVLTLTKDVAAAQQEAAKNLAGVSLENISQTLEKDVPRIALAADFADLPALTKALGSSASIVGDNLAKSVVETAAKVERLTPGNLQTTATSTADLVKATGVTDAREAMSMLLSAGSVARPEELGRLSLGAAKAVNAGTLAAPTQDKVEAAKESTAIFAMLSKVDKSGESAATATVQFIAQLNDLFKGRENDPGSTIGRLEAVRNDPELQASMLKDLKGEAIFKPIFESLVNATSTDSAELSKALQTITTDVKIFDAALKTLNVTPQQQAANAIASVDAAVSVQGFGDSETRSKASIAEITEKALNTTTTGFLDSLMAPLDRFVRGLDAASIPAERFGSFQKENLQARKEQLLDVPYSDDIENKIRIIDNALAAIDAITAPTGQAPGSSSSTAIPAEALPVTTAPGTAGNVPVVAPERVQTALPGIIAEPPRETIAVVADNQSQRPAPQPGNIPNANSDRLMTEQNDLLRQQTGLLETIAGKGQPTPAASNPTDRVNVPKPSAVRKQAEEVR